AATLSRSARSTELTRTAHSSPRNPSRLVTTPGPRSRSCSPHSPVRAWHTLCSTRSAIRASDAESGVANIREEATREHAHQEGEDTLCRKGCDRPAQGRPREGPGLTGGAGRTLLPRGGQTAGAPPKHRTRTYRSYQDRGRRLLPCVSRGCRETGRSQTLLRGRRGTSRRGHGVARDPEGRSRLR